MTCGWVCGGEVTRDCVVVGTGASVEAADAAGVSVVDDRGAAVGTEAVDVTELVAVDCTPSVTVGAGVVAARAGALALFFGPMASPRAIRSTNTAPTATAI